MKKSILLLVLLLTNIASVGSCGSIQQPEVQQEVIDTTQTVVDVAQTVLDLVDSLMQRVEYVEALCKPVADDDTVITDEKLFACTSINDAKLYVIARRELYENARAEAAKSKKDNKTQDEAVKALTELDVAATQLQQIINQQSVVLTTDVVRDDKKK